MKFFILCVTLILGTLSVLEAKHLKQSAQASEPERWATSCRKRKTSENRRLYAVKLPTATETIPQHPNPLQPLPQQNTDHSLQLQEPLTQIKPVVKKKSPIKQHIPVDADVAYKKKESIIDAEKHVLPKHTEHQDQPAPAHLKPTPLHVFEEKVGQDTPIAQHTTRTITVKNGITKKMRTYKHWGTSHEPVLTLRINGIVIPENELVAIEIANNELTADYHANFYGGMRTSADSAVFALDQGIPEIVVTFAWDKTPRIVIDGATVVVQKK